MLKIWEDKFFASSIIDSIIHQDSNWQKHESYVTDLKDGNFENNLNTTIATTSIEGDHINNSCIYSDINDRRQNFGLRLLSTSANIISIVTNSDLLTLIVISYYSKSQLVLLNN